VSSKACSEAPFIGQRWEGSGVAGMGSGKGFREHSCGHSGCGRAWACSAELW
jgi:hypothetical protein